MMKLMMKILKKDSISPISLNLLWMDH